jgi:hypothetical protein
MARLSDNQRSELEALYRESLALVEWYTDNQGFKYGAGVRAGLEKARANSRLGDMRAIARELRSFISALPPDIRANAYRAVEMESGVSVAPSDILDAATAEAILTRGYIETNAEYYLLREYLERVANDPRAAHTMRPLQGLLDTFRGNGSSAR